MPVPPPSGPPLLVTADPALLTRLRRALAAAGSTSVEATAGPLLERAHRTALLVLCGPDALGSGALRDLPRRAGVLVVGVGEPSTADRAAAEELGAEKVLALPGDEAVLLERLRSAARPPVRPGRLVVVGGACGGVGTSTLAVALALVTATAGREVLLVDGDPLGGGLDLLLGLESDGGVRWPDLGGLRGRVDAAGLLAVLPRTGGVRVLSGGRDPAAATDVEPTALLAVVEAVRVSGRPVVVDLPRGSPAAAVLVTAADLAVLVVPGRLRPSCAARLMLADAWSGAVVVLRRGAGLTATEVSRLLDAPVVAELGTDRTAAARAEAGEPPPLGPRSPWAAPVAELLAAAAPAAVEPAATVPASGWVP